MYGLAPVQLTSKFIHALQFSHILFEQLVKAYMWHTSHSFACVGSEHVSHNFFKLVFYELHYVYFSRELQCECHTKPLQKCLNEPYIVGT